MKDDRHIEGPDRSKTETIIWDSEPPPGPESPSRSLPGPKRLIARLGMAGFLFFLIKGVVLYILIPLGLLKWVGGC